MARVKFSEIVVLCEGSSDETFIRTLLKQRGYSPHKIRVLPYPKGKGSGKAFVCNKFVNEVKAMRKWQAKALIVMFDADKDDVNGWKRTLNKLCQDATITPRDTNEAILAIIPKRNIETWYAYLSGQEWEEGEAKKFNKSTDLAKDSAKELDRMCFKDQALRKPAPPSLEEACREWKRFKA